MSSSAKDVVLDIIENHIDYYLEKLNKDMEDKDREVTLGILKGFTESKRIINAVYGDFGGNLEGGKW